MDIPITVSCKECGSDLERESDADTGRHGIEVSVGFCEKCRDTITEEAAEEKEGELKGEIEELKEQLRLALEHNLKSEEDIETVQEITAV